MYRNITLPVVLYGCETWSLTLRDELRPNLRERDHLQDSDIDCRTILRWIIRKWNGWT